MPVHTDDHTQVHTIRVYTYMYACIIQVKSGIAYIVQVGMHMWTSWLGLVAIILSWSCLSLASYPGRSHIFNVTIRYIISPSYRVIENKRNENIEVYQIAHNFMVCSQLYPGENLSHTSNF